MRSTPARIWVPALSGVVVTLAACALLLPLLVPGAGAADRFGPPKIGVIDLSRAFDESDMKKKFQEELDADYQAKRNQLTELDKEIQRLKGEMDLVKEGSDEHRNLQTQILHKTADLKFEADQAEKDFNRKLEQKFSIVLELVSRKTAEYAEANAIDLVFQRNFQIDKQRPAWESVFYARPEYDLTDDVIRLINGT